MITIKDEYLGDGVYASFDGYQIWLAVNHHDNKIVALEPSVLWELVEYARRINDVTNSQHFKGIEYA